MSRVRLRRPIPWRPRLLYPAAAGIVASTVILRWFPATTMYLGGGDVAAPRTLASIEYAPMVVALLLCLGLAPRLADWDRYGAPGTRIVALINGVLVVIIPLVLFALALVFPSRAFTFAWGAADQFVPYASNIAVAALLASVLVSVLGRLVGTVVWTALLLAVMVEQAALPAEPQWLPLTVTVTRDGALYTAPAWPWIVLLAIASGVLAWVRRSVPLQWAALRPEE